MAPALPSLFSNAHARSGRSRTVAPEGSEAYLEELAQELRERWKLTVETVVTSRAEPAERLYRALVMGIESSFAERGLWAVEPVNCCSP